MLHKLKKILPRMHSISSVKGERGAPALLLVLDLNPVLFLTTGRMRPVTMHAPTVVVGCVPLFLSGVISPDAFGIVGLSQITFGVSGLSATENVSHNFLRESPIALFAFGHFASLRDHCENGGEKVVHWSGGIISLRAAE
jgi:hypothetical protein